MPRRPPSWTGASSSEPCSACKEGAIVRLSDLIRSPDPGEEGQAKGTPASAPAGPASSGSPADNGSGQALPGGAQPAPVAARVTPAPAGGAPGENPVHPGATEILGELGPAVEVFLEAARANQPLPLAPLEKMAARLVDVLASGDELVIRALDVRGGQGSLATHCIHVGIFAVRIAAGMDLPRGEQVKAALAGLVHDVGMVRFPPDFAQVDRALTAREREELRRHPEEGYTILSRLGPAYKRLADVAHQEHEREDGSGYPRGLPGDQIGETARIVGLADVYESVTHPRPHRKAVVPFEAVREILTNERCRFTERALKGLLKGLSAFPVGSLVRLNTREVARVVTSNPAFALRPVVEVLFDAAGDRAPGRRIDLAKNGLQYIVDSVTVHEVL